MCDLPNVSILIPTYNRRNFLPLIMTNLNQQTYPKDKLECVIYDDHISPLFINKEEVSQVSKMIGISINYIHNTTRHLGIGEKRNKLVKLAKYKICINMDDDDIYVRQYIEYSVGELQKSKFGIVGSNEMIFCYPHYDFKMTGIQCESKRQIHEATMCFTKKHFNSMGGFVKGGNGEGTSMIDYNEKNCGKTNVANCMICLCHSNNTCSKEMFKDKDLEGECKITDELKQLLKECNIK